MQKISLGDFQIQKVLDTQFLAPLEMIFQEHDWSVFEQNADWLAPTQVDMDKRMPWLSFHSYLIQTGTNTILIDACIGNHKDRGGAPGFHMGETKYLDQLTAAGVSVEDIDYVMCTHMHADHVGWNTQLIDGRWVPTFPNAMYVFAEKEYKHWEKQAAAEPDGPWQERSYYDSVLPVMDAGQACLVDLDFELENGVWLESAPGHSPGNMMINAKSNGKHGVFSGDVVHHAVQVAEPLWYTNFCMDPALASATRKAFVDRVADTDTLILPAHFAGQSAGHIRGKGDGLIFDFVAGVSS